MSDRPILVLQMQRMGDLILSFPLLAWLQRLYPQRPLWVVGEESFFLPLMPLSPPASYFSYNNTQGLLHTPFSLVINLSHRPEAAMLAGSVVSEELIGPYTTKDGERYIRGNWQLYRASLTHNNHYNRYHWCDLNSLDCIPLSIMRRTSWPPIRSSAESATGRVGLFLGASEEGKRPSTQFWRDITQLLLEKGLRPVLLGGEAEKPLGQEVAQALGVHALNLCGHFDIRQLALFIQQLDALVTPDTGPMHIATWVGTRVINLSMGNVSPWETGPMSPGHSIIRANVPCLDCWECTQPEMVCKKSFEAHQVCHIIESLLRASPITSPHEVDNLHVLCSERRNGLYWLEHDKRWAVPYESGLSVSPPSALRGSCSSLGREKAPQGVRSAHNAVGLFWHGWFSALFELQPRAGCEGAWRKLCEVHPTKAKEIQEEARRLLMILLKSIKMEKNPFIDESVFWQEFTESFRPFTGYLQLYSQNTSSHKNSLRQIVLYCEMLLEVVASV